MAKHHVLELGDDDAVDPEDGLGWNGEPTVRSPYTVLNELFKNGKTYAPGDTIMLDPRTAANFAAAGDIDAPEES